MERNEVNKYFNRIHNRNKKNTNYQSHIHNIIIQRFSNNSYEISSGNRQEGYGMKDIRYDSTNQLSSNNDGNYFRRYNWTEIERVDITDLQMQLKGLKPFTQYEILLQAFNKYGRGPVAKIEAFTAGDGNIIRYKLACMALFPFYLNYLVTSFVFVYV